MERRKSVTYKKTNGSKWIKPVKREAIYRRDDKKCVYCGRDHSLTLDHITPRVYGDQMIAVT